MFNGDKGFKHKNLIEGNSKLKNFKFKGFFISNNCVTETKTMYLYALIFTLNVRVVTIQKTVLCL